MAYVRALRLNHGLTLSELALMSGVPARVLAQIEHGLEPLDPHSRARLAAIFNVSPTLLSARAATLPADGGVQLLPQAAAVVAFGLAAALTLTQLLPLAMPQPKALLPSLFNRSLVQPRSPAPPVKLNRTVAQSRPSAPPVIAFMPLTIRVVPPVQHPADSDAASVESDVAALQRDVLTERQRAAVHVAPSFTLRADGPHGCPLLTPQRLLITQGYGEGTHAPAATMGAVDLVIDADGDGHDEPDATRATSVLATLGGVAHVFPNSWPGGNFVIVVNEQAGWSTAYGHLGTLAVADGAEISAGTVIGTVGSTGMASGPHLHYEVRSAHGNVDPAPLLECRL